MGPKVMAQGAGGEAPAFQNKHGAFIELTWSHLSKGWLKKQQGVKKITHNALLFVWCKFKKMCNH